MRSSLPRTAVMAMVALAAWGGTVHGASVRVTGPSEIVPGTTYTLYVEAENTALGGEPTDGIQWRLAAPQFLSFEYFGRPSSGDFFSQDDGTPIGMFAEGFYNPLVYGDPCVRLVDVPGSGPADRSWTSAYIRVAEYRFRIRSDLTAPLPSGDDFVLSDVFFSSPDADEQPFTNLTPAFDFGITLSRADFNRDTKVNAADISAFAACVTGPDVPYDLNQLPSGCTCGTVNVNGQDYLRADFDHDGDVDQNDFGQMQKCFSGDALADPNCGNELLGAASATVVSRSVSSPSAVLQDTGAPVVFHLVRLRNSATLSVKP